MFSSSSRERLRKWLQWCNKIVRMQDRRGWVYSQRWRRDSTGRRSVRTVARWPNARGTPLQVPRTAGCNDTRTEFTPDNAVGNSNWLICMLFNRSTCETCWYSFLLHFLLYHVLSKWTNHANSWILHCAFVSAIKIILSGIRHKVCNDYLTNNTTLLE